MRVRKREREFTDKEHCFNIVKVQNFQILFNAQYFLFYPIKLELSRPK